MKRLIRTILFTATALFCIWYFLPDTVAEKPLVIQTISPHIDDVYETVTCTGILTYQRTSRLSVGIPSEITEVYVKAGDHVLRGQPLLRYRPLSADETTGHIASVFSHEAGEKLETLTDTLDGAAILAAAEYYGTFGELPSYFSDFYLPQPPSAEPQNGTILAPFDSVITALNVSEGDIVSGLFPAAAVADQSSMAAVLRVPESCLSKLREGQQVNVSGAAFGSSVYSGTITEIGNTAVTSGGLLTKSETFVEAVVTLRSNEALMSGLTVKGNVFLREYENAVVIPHEAITTDDSGMEYVYQCVNGVARKRPISYLYENDDGVVVSNEFHVSDVLVAHPGNELYDGCSVTAGENGGQ